MKKITLILGLTLLVAFILAVFFITRDSNGLSADQIPVVVPPQTVSSAAMSELPLDLNVANLRPLEGALYELWIISGQQISKGGLFNIVAGQVNFLEQSQDSDLPLAVGDQIMITIGIDGASNHTLHSFQLMESNLPSRELTLR